MPRAAPRPCTFPGCAQFAESGNSRCKGHLKAVRKAQDRQRGTSRQRGYGGDWQHARAEYLRAHPLCASCQKDGRLTPATVVDHIVPHEIDESKRPATAGQWRLFWDRDNWQSMCVACHKNKTRSFDGWAFEHELRIPAQLRPSGVPLTIVCGPPGSGKSRYVAEHAQPGDRVIDLDIIRAELDSVPLYQAPAAGLRRAMLERNRQLDRLASLAEGEAWLILSAPKFSDRRRWRDLLQPRQVLVLAVAPEVCKARIRADARRAGFEQDHCKWVDEWWREYSADALDTVSRG